MDSPFIEGDQVSAGQESESSAAQGYASSSSMAPSLGEYIGTQAGTTTGQIARFASNQYAKHFGPEQPMLDPETANKNYAPEGEKLFTDSVPESVAKSIGRARANEIDRNAILERYADQHNPITNFAASVPAYLLDPIRAGTAFIPGVGEEAIIAELGEGLLAKTAARAVSGSTGMVAATAPVVAAQYAIGQTEGSDYDLNAAFRDLVFAAPMGAFMHAGINPMLGYAFRQGKAALGYEARSDGQTPPTGNLAPLDPHIEAQAEQFLNTDAFTREAAMRASVAQTVDGRPVDVSPIIPDHTEAARTVAPEAFNEYDALREERDDVAQRLAPRDEEGEEPARNVLSEAGRILPNDVRVNFEQALSEQAPSSEPLFALSGHGNIPLNEHRQAAAIKAGGNIIDGPDGPMAVFGEILKNPSPDDVNELLYKINKFGTRNPKELEGIAPLRWASDASGNVYVGDAMDHSHGSVLEGKPQGQAAGWVTKSGQFIERGDLSEGERQDWYDRFGSQVQKSSSAPLLQIPEYRIAQELSNNPQYALSGENQNRPRTPTEVAVYHGTNQPFDKFDQSKTIRSNLATGEKENAFYFSDTPETANSYLHHFDPNEPTTDTGQNVLKSFIETKNFKTVDFDGHDFSRDGGVRLASEISQAKKEGYHGLIAKDIGDLGGTQNQYITWTPGTVRSALSDNQLYALNGFHHGPEQAVENFSQNKADAGTWKKVIEGRSGWKDYSDLTGVHDFLGDRKSISKDELLSYMRAHSADLDEKVLGSEESKAARGQLESEMERIQAEKYPDGQNIAPDWTPEKQTRLASLVDQLRKTSAAATTKFAEHKIPGGEPGSYREHLITLKGFDYDEPHFGKGVLVHNRFDDREVPGYGHTLFWQESQATGHQKGRTEGYVPKGEKGEKLRNEYAAAIEHQEDVNRRLEEFHDSFNGPRPYFKSPEYLAINDLVHEAHNRVIAAQNAIGGHDTVPDAPFKGDLWLELSAKRMLRYAVEHGYDAISWARSDQIAKAVGADPENLKIQYDQKIGKFLDKYTKKWGAKVDVAEIEGLPFKDRPSLNRNAEFALSQAGGDIQTALGRLRKRVETEPQAFLRKDNEEAIAQLQALSKHKDSGNQILRITPQMRESVMGGQAYAAASRAGELLHIQRSVEGAINAGREFHNTPLTVHETHAVIRQHQSEYPNNVPVGALTSVKPVNGGKNVRFNYRSPDGREFFLDAPRSALFTGRATFDEAKSIIGLMEFGRTRSPDELSRTVGGGIRHELVHALRAADRFSVSEWGSLLDHANNLDVLGWSRYDFYRLLGDEQDVSLRRTSLRDEYLKAYAHITNEAVRSEFMDQEAVAHMVEVYHHLLKLPSDHPLRRRLMPQYRDIQPIMQSLFLGEFAKRTPGEVKSLNDNPQYALSDKERMANQPRTPTEVKVYHGTSSGPFDKLEGDLIFFDKDPKISNYYSTLTDSGQRNIPAYIDTKDFKTVDFRGKRHDEGPPLDTKDKDYDRQPETIEEHAYHAQEQGYKGLIVKNVKEPYLGTKDPHADLKKSTQYVAWTPGTVRSALSDNSLYALSGGGKGAEPDNPRDVIIKVAMGGDPVKSFNAQAVRALKSLNLFTDKEWGALEQEARSKGWIETSKVKSADEGDHIGTAISEQYAEWRSGKEMSQPTTSIFQRIKDFFERAANYLRGHGFQNAEDVFERIRSGELKDRYEVPFKDRLNEINGRMQELAPQIKAAYARAAATASRPTFAQVSAQQSQLYRDGYSPAIPQSELRQNMEQIYGDKSNNSEGTPEESAKGTGNAKSTDQKGRSNSQAGTTGKVGGGIPIDQELAEAQVRHAQMVDNGFQPTEEEARNFLQISQEMEQAAYLEQAYSQAATCLAQAGLR